MKNTQTIGREDGTRMEEGNIINFDQTSEPLEDKIDVTLKESKEIESTFDLEKIAVLDIRKLAGLYDAYKESHSKIYTGDYSTRRDAKEICDIANKFLDYKDAFLTVHISINYGSLRIARILDTIQHIPSTTRKEICTPESIKEMFFRELDDTFTKVNEAVSKHDSSKNTYPELEKNINEITRIYTELNSANNLAIVNLLIRNIKDNLEYIPAQIRTRSNMVPQKYVNMIQDIHDFAKDKKKIMFSCWCEEMNEIGDASTKIKAMWAHFKYYGPFKS